MSSLATVTRKILNGKCTSKMYRPIKYFVSIADNDIKSLKCLQTFFT